MSRRRNPFASDMALVASTVLATLALQRHVTRTAASSIDPNAPLPAARGGNPLAVIVSRHNEILRGTFDRIGRDRILATAAGVVFYGLLAIFPAITALVSSYGLFADPATISGNLHSLAVMLPGDSFSIVQDEITRVLAKANSTLGLAFAFGLLFAIWSANAGVKAVIDALNVAYEVEEKRGLVRLNLVSLAFTVAGLAAILIMVGAVVGVPVALKHLGLGQGAEQLIQIGRWPVLGLVLLMALVALYGFGPSRPRPKARWLLAGAAFAIVLWLIGSALLSWYLSNFANYTATYGSLGAAIGLMTWMWLSAIIVLVGAELNSEVERQAMRR
ncbi:MAG TPA: YihY/virulence factor BrkB family protein [Bradyrhizobium sp.]|uniref:YihY/virulence factor BrkB family protein n=1 Tax=Bradyrhizobium sp. TaxID=376 RepID=UPI002D80C938|nr:YihY/virulence factor BrkB family protein [Bradyrhizobium sp.]HET7888920.1 YihY/virulence factor BrkB family protein [Bradyrhizobium sp.]